MILLFTFCFDLAKIRKSVNEGVSDEKRIVRDRNCPYRYSSKQPNEDLSFALILFLQGMEKPPAVHKNV
jgi:hypothetical protein